MGYENNSRPDTIENLICDINFDLTDLIELVNTGAPKEKVIKSIYFIKETCHILQQKNKEQ